MENGTKQQEMSLAAWVKRQAKYEQHKAYRAAHPEIVRARVKAYYERTKETRRVLQAEYMRVRRARIKAEKAEKAAQESAYETAKVQEA
jgi:hypothetical protein